MAFRVSLKSCSFANNNPSKCEGRSIWWEMLTVLKIVKGKGFEIVLKHERQCGERKGPWLKVSLGQCYLLPLVRFKASYCVPGPGTLVNPAETITGLTGTGTYKNGTFMSGVKSSLSPARKADHGKESPLLLLKPPSKKSWPQITGGEGPSQWSLLFCRKLDLLKKWK